MRFFIMCLHNKKYMYVKDSQLIIFKVKESGFQPSMLFVYKLILICGLKQMGFKSRVWEVKRLVQQYWTVELKVRPNNTEYTHKMPCPVGLYRRVSRD